VTKADFNLGAQHVTGRIPDCAFFGGKWRTYREKIDFRAVGFPSGPAAATLFCLTARNLAYWHCFQHLRIKIIGKDAINCK